MFSTALVALDLAPAERPIVDCLPDLQSWGVRRVVLTHVIQVGYMQGAALAHEPARAALRALAQRIEAAGSHGNGVLLQGKASSEIARYAASQDVSLIVVGKRGQNPLASLVVGSTAANLCEIAGRPVLMVP